MLRYLNSHVTERLRPLRPIRHGMDSSDPALDRRPNRASLLGSVLKPQIRDADDLEHRAPLNFTDIPGRSP